MRPVITSVAHAIQEAYVPSRDIAVDEAMIAFQGRSTLKQYMPLKPTKRGIKVWALADSCNGYIHRFEIYTGKGDGDKAQTGLGAKVVTNLTSHLQGKNYHVYCDNFFYLSISVSSPP